MVAFTLTVGASEGALGIAQEVLRGKLTHIDDFNWGDSVVRATLSAQGKSICKVDLTASGLMTEREVIDYLRIDPTLVDFDALTFDGYSYADEQKAA